jgi:hypothetical protein
MKCISNAKNAKEKYVLRETAKDHIIRILLVSSIKNGKKKIIRQTRSLKSTWKNKNS